MSKTVLFQIIQLSISTQFKCKYGLCLQIKIYFLCNAMMRLISSLVQIITTHTQTYTRIHKKMYSVISFLLPLVNFSTAISWRQPQSCHETHVSSHTHTHTHTLTNNPQYKFYSHIHTHTRTQKSHTNLNINIRLAVLFDFSNIFLYSPMIVVIRRHETLGHR